MKEAICEISPYLPDEEKRANLRLIAAVPQMYDFVKEIAAIHDPDPDVVKLVDIARLIVHSVDGPEPKPEVFEVGEMFTCKVCGSSNQGVTRIRFWNAPPSYTIVCLDCRKMHSDSCRSVEECVKSWNRRNIDE